MCAWGGGREGAYLDQHSMTTHSGCIYRCIHMHTGAYRCIHMYTHTHTRIPVDQSLEQGASSSHCVAPALESGIHNALHDLVPEVRRVQLNHASHSLFELRLYKVLVDQGPHHRLELLHGALGPRAPHVHDACCASCVQQLLHRRHDLPPARLDACIPLNQPRPQAAGVHPTAGAQPDASLPCFSPWSTPAASRTKAPTWPTRAR